MIQTRSREAGQKTFAVIHLRVWGFFFKSHREIKRRDQIVYDYSA